MPNVVEEPETRQVRLSSETHQALKIHAARLKKSMTDVLEEIVKEHLAVVEQEQK